MSEIVSFYDWYLDQKNKPKLVASLIAKENNDAKEPKDIEDEEE